MLEGFTRQELSLLLFLETCAVDHGGAIDGRHMNEDDFDIAEGWSRSGFVEFGRIYSKDVQNRPHGRSRSHWCRLSDRAFVAASHERKARSSRMWAKRKWRKTAEDAEGKDGRETAAR